ncbi:hypothetical protein DFJ58DRAFT_843299 [Suillus subalutaceus]|uniref:uncharacterized protein n=1 Tax=Suillus subalutaceus TaxID=48586 RepID=UPI001B86A039|nr:uncharacterized protein DFJ58DRAFT_843299 [Suillus subalutaceus]KAG1846979.1 hypothetical protein DFJ58DRAFT_843299 [Suillus subalutaceus]
MHTLWFTLLKHGRAPTSWTKIDIQALEFVRLSMRNEFVHFRLCDSDWKTDQLAIRHYPQWTHRPREPGNAIQSTIKQENVREMSLAATTNSKRPQSLTISPSTRRPKKKKDDHVETATGSTALVLNSLANQASMKSRHVLRHEVDMFDTSNEASDALPNIANRVVKIVNPLTGLFKPKEGACNLPPTLPASTSSMSTSSSTAELVAHMASATVNDAINDVTTIPPTSEGNQTFIQLLSNAIISAKDASAHASALPPTTVNSSSAVTILDVDTTTAPNKTVPKKKDPNATKEVHGRATAKSLCAIDWVASNPGSTNAAFENYWRRLDKDEKKKYQDRLALVRTARACAVASPSITGSEVGGAADSMVSAPR